MRYILVLASALLLGTPLLADSILYDNGVVCPGACIDAWQINDGFANLNYSA